MRPLEGIKIVDFTQAHAGSLCTMYLADFGAEIIKIERPRIGDLCRYWPPIKEENSAYFSFLNRGKKSITIDARTEKGKEIIKKLVSKADVVCENFKVGNMEKLGLGYEELKKVNPKIIYASISGFGINGPIKNLPAYDLMLQAMSGIVDLTGFSNGMPTKNGPAIGDHTSGTYLANAICLALIHREKTGEGQRVDVSIMDALFSLLESAPITQSLKGTNPTRIGNMHPIIAPCDTYEAKNGYISIGVTNEDQWKKFCKLIGKNELIDDKRFIDNENRIKNYSELKCIIENYTKINNKEDIEVKLRTQGIACSQVLTIKEAVELQQIRERNMLIKTNFNGGELLIPGIDIKLHRTPGNVKFDAPKLGEYTDEILEEADYNLNQIKEFHKEKIV